MSGRRDHRQEEEEIRSCFRALDEDRTGVITLDNFVVLILGLGFPKTTRDELLQKTNNKTTGITVNEVLKIVSKLPRKDRDAELSATFDAISTNGTCITAQDLEQLSRECNEPLPASQIAAVMEPKTWSREEFQNVMNSL